MRLCETLLKEYSLQADDIELTVSGIDITLGKLREASKLIEPLEGEEAPPTLTEVLVFIASGQATTLKQLSNDLKIKNNLEQINVQKAISKLKKANIISGGITRKKPLVLKTKKLKAAPIEYSPDNDADKLYFLRLATQGKVSPPVVRVG